MASSPLPESSPPLAVEPVPVPVAVEPVVIVQAKTGIWAHFTKLDYTNTVTPEKEIQSRCDHCELELKFAKDKSTGSIHQHLKRKHEGAYQSFAAAKKAKDDKRPSKTPGQLKSDGMLKGQRNIDPFTTRSAGGQEWKPSESRYKAATSSLVRFVCQDSQPFDIVSQPGFIQYSTHLQPLFRPPSRTKLTAAIPAEYEAVQAKMKATITEEGVVISFTLDIWSDATTKHSFISFTGHWIAANWLRRDYLLDCGYFPESHTAAYIT